MSKEKQIEFERNEISEIIAKNFKLNDEQYDPSDFEWAAHQLQMEGYHKRREDGKYIRLEDLKQFPIRKDHYDKEHGNEHFIFGVESVLEYAEYLPTYDGWISVDDGLPEKSGEYLTWHNGYFGLLNYSAELNGWNIMHHDDRSTEIKSVTHWMPLPDAPKGGAE
jgi:hypothetical protein